MTEKLYDLDSYVTEFDCKVISLYSDSNYIYVETDKTAFFPEGGGQTSDRGLLGGAYVENVRLDGGKILHIVENNAENVEKLSIGAVLHGEIDVQKRFSDMQQHSGEHIFSGIVHSLFGFDNVGFHLGSDFVTIDINGELTDEEICKVELLVNEAIWKNLKIHVFYPSPEELKEISYRSKKEIDGPLRIVEIPGVDVCACCAPHVKMTGEIGSFRVVKSERHRGGMRFYVLCGKRNLLDSRERLFQNHLIGTLLCSKETETASHVQKLKDEKAALSAEIVALKRELLSFKAERIESGKRLVFSLDAADAATAREFADRLSQKADEFAAVLFGERGEKFVIISKTDFDLSAVCKKLGEKFGGRGGGRNGIVQGSLENPSGAEEFLKNV